MNTAGVRGHGTPLVSGTNPVGFRRGEKLNSKGVVVYTITDDKLHVLQNHNKDTKNSE
ncbi:MAG: hypothetical protein ACRCUY_01260 [Thermoguttaceae bacterium]